MFLDLKFLKKNQIIGAFSIYLIGSLFLKGISFITIPIFTRILSPEEYGIITIFLTWVSFFAVFIGFQVSSSIASAHIHRGKKNLVRYMKSIVVLSLLSAVFISIICVLFREEISKLLQIEPDLIIHLIIQAYGVSCATVYSIYTIQTKQPKKNVVFSVIVSLLVVSLSILLILNLDEDKYLGRIFASSAIYLIVIFYVIREFVIGKEAEINFKDWKYAIKLSSPLIIHLLANIAISQSDRLFLTHYMGLEVAAVYSVCYNISIVGMILVEVGTKVWSPWYLENTMNKNNASVNFAARMFSLGISLIFIIVLFISPEVLMLMAPEEYWVGKSTLLIVTSGVYFQFLYRFPLTYEQFCQNMKWVAVSTISVCFLNLILNYFFIDSFGLIGAAIATYISYLVLFLIHEYVARKILKDYNIKFSAYLPGIILVASFTALNYLLLNFPYVRYAILFVLFITVIIYFRNRKQLLSKYT